MGLLKKIGSNVKKGADTVKNTAQGTGNTLENTSKDAINAVENTANGVPDLAVKTGNDAVNWAVDTFTSSIVIRNESPVRTWKCTIGPDQEALKIAGLTVQAVSLALTAVSLSGLAVPLGMSMSVTAGLAAVNIAGGKATTIDTINKYAMKLTGTQNSFTVEGAAKSVAEILNVDYQASWKVISPGGAASWDKLTLSLLQQGTCMTSYVDPSNATRVITGTITMKPLWSGATSGASNTYTLQRWENDVKTTATTFSLHE